REASMDQETDAVGDDEIDPQHPHRIGVLDEQQTDNREDEGEQRVPDEGIDDVAHRAGWETAEKGNDLQRMPLALHRPRSTSCPHADVALAIHVRLIIRPKPGAAASG